MEAGRKRGPPFKLFEQLFAHPLTDRGLESFLKDWEKAHPVLGEIIEPARARKAERQSDDRL